MSYKVNINFEPDNSHHLLWLESAIKVPPEKQFDILAAIVKKEDDGRMTLVRLYKETEY